MKTFLLLLLIIGIPVSSLYAQDIRSIDIEKAKESYPNNILYASDGTYLTSLPFAELNGVFYFNADDGIHGNELYRTDGTAAGTYLVKDIYPGSKSANVNDIVVSGNHIYFSATSDAGNPQLWTSDGTAAGTHLVQVVNAGTSSARPTYITDVNGTAYFVATLYYDGDQLWKTDGTEAGTVLVADFTNFNPFYGYSLKSLTNVNGKVFFTALNNANTTDPQLFVTDGTPEGTSLVKDINPFGGDFPCNLTAVNNSLYFCANDGTINSHLWTSDGTEAGTHAVNNANGISLFNNYYYTQTPYTVKNNVLYFQAYDANYDNELYKYNTASATANITLVKDIVPGPTSSYPSQITNVSGTLFFIANTSTFHQQLWKTDGTNGGTVLVKDIAPDEPNAYYYGFTNAGGTLAFAFGDSALGYELWKSDGTAAGTVLVKDIFPGIYSSFPNFFTYSRGKFLFNATDAVKGAEIWTSDGTAGGTAIVKDINQTSSTSSYPQNFTYTGNNKTFFTAGTEKYGYELYTTNGTDRGTKLISDITPGAFGTSETLLTRFQNQLYFVAYHNGYYLSKSDGTAGGTSFYYSLDSIYSYGYIQQMVAADNLLYFTVFNFYTYTQELWRSDGTASGTFALKTNLQYYYALSPVAVGNTLFFSNYDGDTGQELWKSDGTAAGTVLVKDIYPGVVSSNPSSLYNFQGKLYFAADVGYGPFLFTSDGTAAGTKQVKAILLAYATPFAQANGKLFFDAYNTVGQGYELYATDGSSAGTKLVKDINKGPANSSPLYLVNGNKILYFQADNGKDGIELWSSEGTAENTHLVKDITAGINSTYISQRVNVNDKLFFTVNDSLWQSDATEAGTHTVDDATLNGAYNFTYLTAADDRLYFSAYKYSIGQELFTAKVAGQANNEMLISKAASPMPVPDGKFTAKLLLNPVTSQVRLLLNLQQAQQIQVVITDADGRTALTDQRTLPAGEHTVTYASGTWLPGTYFIKIIAADGSSVTLKAIR